MEDEASKAGLAVILCNSDDQERKEKRYLELLEAHQIGSTAARLLLDEADGDGGHQHRQVIFEPELVVRQSTHPAS